MCTFISKFLPFLRTPVILDWGPGYSSKISSWVSHILRPRGLGLQHINFGRHNSIHNKNNSFSINFQNRNSSSKQSLDITKSSWLFYYHFLCHQPWIIISSSWYYQQPWELFLVSLFKSVNFIIIIRYSFINWIFFHAYSCCLLICELSSHISKHLFIRVLSFL